MRGLFYIIFLLIAGAAITLHLKPELREEIGDVPGSNLIPSSTTTLYKWQDENGRWQLSDKPPTGDTPYTPVEVDHDTNVIPSVPTEKNDTKEEKKNATWQDSLYSK